MPKREGKLPDEGTRRAPAILKGEGRAAWNRLAPLLRRMGLLTSIDREAFTVYCQAVAEFDWAVRTLRKHGMITRAGNGARVVHPAHLVEKWAAAAILRFGNEFGLSPAARAGMDVVVPSDVDPDGDGILD